MGRGLSIGTYLKWIGVYDRVGIGTYSKGIGEYHMGLGAYPMKVGPIYRYLSEMDRGL